MNLESLTRMTQKQYSDFWEAESSHLDKQGIYKGLSEFVPAGDALEIGCGAGIATQYLAINRKVLSIDNNAYLLKKAKARVNNSGESVEFLRANLFALSPKEIGIIKDFSPKGIVCWFIGSNPDNVDKHTSDSIPLLEKSKKYRENVEDVLVSNSLCSDSVEWIHLVNRAAVIASATEQDIIASQTEDYNTYVFSKVGFEVIDVKVLGWDRDGSNFMYVNAPNPNLMSGQPVDSVVSILARQCAVATAPG